MNYHCPGCGARHPGDTTCQDVFDAFLALEFSDPAYGAVHMLTVACFMIQHGRYSDTGLVWIEQQLHAHLEQGVPVEYIRRQAAKETGQDVRGWKVMRQPGDPPQTKIIWSVTIADVAANYGNAPGYREWVARWARATLQDMQPLTRKPL